MLRKRINYILKKKGMKRAELLKKLNINYSSLKARENNPKLSTMIEVADALDCEVHELIETSSKFFHSYDDKGNWQGVRRK